MGENLVIDIIGWTGVICLLVAYALISTRKLAGDSAVYQLLNILGAGLLIANSYYYGAYPSVGINLVWIGIGAYALMRVWLADKSKPDA